MKSVSQIFKEIFKKLQAAGNEHPHLEAGWMIEKFSGMDSVQRIREPERLLSEEVEQSILNGALRRQEGEPLAYILGEKEFCGLKFKVNSNVLIPRPETELLVDWAVNWIEKNTVGPIEILDLGAGSGCIGLSIVSLVPRVKLTAVESSAKALGVAKENTQLLGLESRVELVHLDATKANYLLKSFDLVVANPPYIDIADTEVDPHVRKYEPHQALFAERGGIGSITDWLSALPPILKPSAAVGFEIGYTQGEQVLRMFRDLGIFSKQYVVKDYSQHDRFICGEK